jgi:hypothetical protein
MQVMIAMYGNRTRYLLRNRRDTTHYTKTVVAVGMGAVCLRLNHYNLLTYYMICSHIWDLKGLPLSLRDAVKGALTEIAIRRRYYYHLLFLQYFS